MAIRRARPGKMLVGTQISRRDFLKISGTGLAGAALLGTAGCGSVFEGGGGGGSAQKTDTLNINLLTEVPDLVHGCHGGGGAGAPPRLDLPLCSLLFPELVFWPFTVS